MVPLPVEQVVPPHRQIGVVVRGREDVADHIVGRIPLLAGIPEVLRSSDIDMVHNLPRKDGMQYHLEEGRLRAGVQLVIHSRSIFVQHCPLFQDGVRLIVVDD